MPHGHSRLLGYQYSFLQVSTGESDKDRYHLLNAELFEVDKQWRPPIAPHDAIVCEVLVENAVGIWWEKFTKNTPTIIGAVAWA